MKLLAFLGNPRGGLSFSKSPSVRSKTLRQAVSQSVEKLESRTLLSAYSTAVLADHPVAFYPLNETSGAVAHDASGNAHDGTYSNATLNQPGGVFGDVSGSGAASFAGTGSVTLPSSSDLSITGNITLEAWVKTTATGLSLIGGYSSPYPFSGYALGIGQIVPGTPAYWNGSSWHSALTTVNDGQWHQLVAVATDTSCTLFVDGQADGAFAGNAQPQGSGGPKMLAAASSTYGPYIGSMEDAAIFASALSPAQVAAEYNAAAGITNLSATATATGSIHLDWWLNTTNATALEVQRSTDGVVFTPLTTTLSGSATGYDDTGLDENTHYWYQVRLAQPQASPFCNLADTFTLPIAPTDLQASANGSSEVDLTWTNNSSTSPVFDIERSDDGGTTFYFLDETAAGATAYADTAPHDGTTVYRVDALNGDDSRLNSSTSASVTLALTPPSDLSAVGLSDSEIDLSWTNNSYGATGIEILGSTDGATFTPLATLSDPTTTTYSDIGLSPGTQYYYEVEATQGSATSEASNIADDITAPATPSGLAVAAPNSTELDLSWEATPGATGYDIQRQATGGTWQTIDQIDATPNPTDTDSAVWDWTHLQLPHRRLQQHRHVRPFQPCHPDRAASRPGPSHAAGRRPGL